MSEKQIRNLLELTESMRQNESEMSKKIVPREGSDQAMVLSAAKYKKALELLSKE